MCYNCTGGLYFSVALGPWYLRAGPASGHSCGWQFDLPFTRVVFLPLILASLRYLVMLEKKNRPGDEKKSSYVMFSSYHLVVRLGKPILPQERFIIAAPMGGVR
jgi:hypothetical protein